MLFSKNFIISTVSFLAVLLLSFWFWDLQKEIVVNGNYNSVIMLKSIIAFTVSFAFIAIVLMMGSWIFGFLIAFAIPAAIAFYFGFYGAVLLPVIGASFLLGLMAYWSAKKEKSDRLKLSINNIKIGLNLYFFTSLIVLTAIVYQYNFYKGEIKISESVIRPIMPLIESQIKSQIPFYSSEMTTDQLLVIAALSGNEITINQKNISADLQKKIQAKIVKTSSDAMREALQLPEVQRLIVDDFIKNNPAVMTKLRSDYGKKFSINLKENQGLVSALADGINAYIGKFTEPFKDYLPIVLVATFFFSFKVLGSLFVGTALFLAGLIFSLFKLFGFVKINKVGTMQEQIEN